MKEYILSKGAEALSYVILALALVVLILWRASSFRTLHVFFEKRGV